MALLAAVDRRAVGLGALTAIAAALPFALLARVVVDDADDPLSVPFLLLVMVGLGAGGYAAARHAPRAPYSNGALASLGGWAVIQALGVVRLLLTDGELSVGSIVFAGFIAYSAGIIGALVAERRASRA